MSPSLNSDTMNQTVPNRHSKLIRLDKSSPHDGSCSSGIFNERVLVLVFHALRWDIPTLCRIASVNRRLRALSKRVLWRELCAHHAPRIMHALTSDDTGGTKYPPNTAGGEYWHALAKLLFFCCGCRSTRHFTLPSGPPTTAPQRPPLPPSLVRSHFVNSSRFSKTSGKSFLSKKCRADVLYVTDPCEHHHHENGGSDDVLGVYRGVFRGFTRSRTREWLVRRGVAFEEGVRCPYCGARVWSMTSAKMMPRKCTARRLGSRDLDSVEYFICLNGHLHGACWLVQLSSEDEEELEEDGCGSEDDDYDDDELMMTRVNRKVNN